MRREITLTCPGSGSPGARLRCWRMRSVNLYMTRAQDLEVNVAFGKEIVLKNVKLKESSVVDVCAVIINIILCAGPGGERCLWEGDCPQKC